MYKKIFHPSLTILYVGMLAMFMVSARPFAGLNIFGFKLGELIIGFCCIVSLLFLITPKKYFTNFFPDLVYLNLFKSFILCFILIAILSGSSFSNPYTFRSSSFIWTISIIFFGSYFLNNKDLEKYYLLVFLPIPFVNYLFATGYYPNFIMDFYIKYSDKFQFIKASDLFITLIVINILYFKIKGTNLITLIYLVATTGIYFPLMLFNSRGAFISTFLYLFLQIYFSRSFFKNNIKQFFYIIVLLLIFSLISTLYIGNSFELVQVAPEPEVISEAVEGIAKNKIPTREVLGFYICENRLCSKDNTLDWRLDIWGDLVNDMSSKNLIFKGYGFNEIFPVMLDPSAPGRIGRDGLNENVHNYFVNIFGRLGFIGLAISVAFYYRLIKSYYQKNKSLYVLVLLLPVFFNSFFDANMEGVQYPFIFFSFLGYIYFNNLNKGKLKSKIL